MRLRIEIQERKIDDLISKMNAIEDDELKSHFAKYVCIKISGYLENVTKSLISDFIDKSCPSAVQTFVKNKIKTTTNLSCDRLCVFLESFDKDWKSKFESKLNEKNSSSLNSLIANRNAIAHGGQDNITARSIVNYYEDLKEIIDVLKSIVKK